MINTQKLVEYIESAPFPRTERDRLITLACVADEEHQRHIYLLVKKFAERVKNSSSLRKAQQIRQKGKEIRRFMHKKAEEIYGAVENNQLQNLELTMNSF